MEIPVRGFSEGNDVPYTYISLRRVCKGNEKENSMSSVFSEMCEFCNISDVFSANI